MSNKITCTCGHSWNKSSSSKKDMKICHICGKDNTMKNGGWLDAYDEEMQLGGSVYPANYVPQAQNGLEGSTDGFTDQGFNYNGAWGGTMEYGGNVPKAQDGLWNTNKTQWVDSIHNARRGDLNFVQRYFDPSAGSIPTPRDVEGWKPGQTSTHLMAYDPGTRRVYPEVVNVNGKLQYMPGDQGWNYADDTKQFIEFPTAEQAGWYANNGYKKGTNVLKGKTSTPKKAMGGNIPGSVGFSYARTKGIPDNGPYAKKTMASAQDGLSVDEQMAEASTNMWGYPTEPNFVEAYKKPTKKTTSKKTSTKSKSVKEKTDEPDSFEEKKPSIDFRANRERPQMDALRPQTPMMLSRYNPYTGYIREGDSDPNKWNDDRSIFSDARAKERGEKLWDGTKKVTALTQFAPLIGLPSKVLNTSMGLTDAYYSNREKDPINTLINIAGAMPSGNRYISGIQALSDLTDNFGFEKKPEKKQNGGEMSFYQNGLDWTPRNISRDGSEIPQAQMGTMVTPLDFSKPLGTLEGVSEVMSAPARTATYLLTGKYQDPSQALGIKNPWGALAADMVLDPMNLIGAGVATKAVKAAKAATKASKVVNPVISSAVKNVANKFKSEIDWSKWNSEIPSNQSLLQEYNLIEQTSKANDSWMKNPDGSAFQGTPEEFVQQNSENFKKAFPNGYGVTYKGVGANGRMDNIRSTESSEYMLPFFGGDENIANKFNSQYHNSNSPYISHNNIKFNPEANAEVYKFLYPKDANPIIFDANKGYWGNFKLPETAISNDSQYQIIKNTLGDNASTGSLQKYVKDNNINNLTIENLVEKGNSTLGNVHIINPRKNKFPKSAIGNNGMFDMTNPNIYKSVLPYAVPAAIGAGALQQKKQGGEITKDDNGYWNPENWGKPVEIGSNNITMKGLQEMGYDNPLLGISDTGDVQMMYPGEDYKFDGESVTEYPVAQLGKTVPPLNVSNPNDPRLKAYNDSLSIYNTTSQQYKNIKKTGKLRDSDVDVDSEKKYSFKDYMDEYNRPNSDFNIFNSGTNSKMQPINVSQFRGKGILGYLDYGRQAQYKKPEQEVVLNPPSNVPKKPQPKPKPQPVKKKPTHQPKPVQEQPTKKPEQPIPVERKQNTYEGSPVYSATLGSGAPSALVGFANPQGDTTYIKPEDYQRYGVPAYGKELIESKTKKKKNGGWLDKWN